MGTEQNLSRCEEMIMYCIWDNSEDMTAAQIQNSVSRHFNKAYEKTTIWTFLKRLREKGYVEVKKIKNCSYYYAIVTKKAFLHRQTDSMIELWFDGKPSNLIAALGQKEKLTKQQAEEVRKILDELDRHYISDDKN